MNSLQSNLRRLKRTLLNKFTGTLDPTLSKARLLLMSIAEKKPKKLRADQLLLERGLVPTRSRGAALILAGEVFSGDRRVDKAGEKLPVDVPLRVREQQKYVSRGGLKLEGALKDFEFSPEGMKVVDIGASTGGFTDCVLQAGAQRVYAVDVGHGQLAEKLRQDERVVVMERTNARTLTIEQVEGPADLVVVDASFISLDRLLPALFSITAAQGYLLALIKPQFEVGREEASKGGGVIRDQKVRRQAIEKILQAAEQEGYTIVRETECRVHGPKGNVEHFCLCQKSS